MEYPTLAASSSPQTHSDIEIEIKNATSIDASSASSSTAAELLNSSSSSGNFRYDVFINCRSTYMKRSLAVHLYHRLVSHGFRTFLDQEEFQAELKFSSQILAVIKTASVHVAILSPTYAESSWCLDQLVQMLDSGATIIPVFYQVALAELRWTQNKSGAYGKYLHKLQMMKTLDPQTGITVPRFDSAIIQKWRNALTSVAEISGFDLEAFNGDEGALLDKVLQRVLNLLPRPGFETAALAQYRTGLDERVKEFETAALRQHHSGKVQVVGIVGLGGVGKTTLARELFNRKKSNYNKSYFVPDVRENARSSSLHSLQSKVMKGLIQGLTQSDLNIENIFEGIAKLKKHLQSSHVLLILDDIDHRSQLDAFLPVKDVLSSDSLILITSRYNDVLRSSGVEESSIYKLPGLSYQHSRELFCSYAFLQQYPFRGFEDLVDQFLMVCDGLPLSLKVFGGHLQIYDQSRWEHTLHRVHEVPNDILERLKISYDALCEEEQQIFLDIACFFVREKRNMTMGVWDGSDWTESLGFENLESKYLVEVDSDGYIRMHDHLRDMGRMIALDKLPRRLWRPTENIDDLLQQSSVITEVRGIRMFPTRETDSRDETVSGYQSSSKGLFGNRVMKLPSRLYNTRLFFLRIGAMKLQILQTEGQLLERILRKVHSPNLIWLSWRDCPYSCLPSWIPMKNLRVLKVEGKVLQTLWQGRSQAPFELRELEISGRLSNIPKSIGQLKHLERIVLHHVDLQKLPDEFCRLRSLKVLVLRRCSKLKALPESFDNVINLEQIELSECHRMERLPDSFGNLTRLRHIEMSECRRLERLPNSFGKLLNVGHIELSSCQSLVELPDSFGNLMNLQHIELSECRSLERLPESFGNLQFLQHIELSGCGILDRLPDSFGNLRNLLHVELSGCRGLERLPDSFGILMKPRYIKLSEGWRLKSLPNSFGNLKALQHLDMSECRSLEKLPSSFCNLTELRYINLFGCKSLQRLPNSFGNLRKLQHINLHGCENLQRLPDSICNLTNVQHINLSHCKNLQELRSIKTLVFR